MITNVLPGDVLAVRTPGGVFSPPWWIRIGAAIRGLPNLSNHILVVHHTDVHGTVVGVEGRPGGVGQVDCGPYLRDPATLTNAAQPKTTAQRAGVCNIMEKLLGTPYDWAAIVADGEADLGIHLPGWEPKWGLMPGHVVCSSLAQYGYLKNELKAPKGDRGCQPGDWDAFILARGWE